MADTQFNTLYPMIRAACGDYGAQKNGTVDSESYEFRDDMIEGAISLALLDIPDYSETGSTGDKSITPGLVDDKDKQIVIFSTALILLMGSEDISLSTDIGIDISKDGRESKVAYVVTKLKSLLRSKNIPIASDSSKNLLKYFGTRLSQEAT